MKHQLDQRVVASSARGADRLTAVWRIPLVLMGALLATIAFYEARKAYWDAQVRELCAKDGGVKVYEKVKLPSTEFNEWMQPKNYRPTKGENALGDSYRVATSVRYFNEWNPQVARHHIQLWRRSDNRLLGESISYSRGGGDFPSPSHGSSFICPREYGDIPLISKIFLPLDKE